MTNPDVWHFVPRLIPIDINAVDTRTLHGLNILLVALHKVYHLVTNLWKIWCRSGNNVGQPLWRPELRS